MLVCRECCIVLLCCILHCAYVLKLHSFVIVQLQWVIKKLLLATLSSLHSTRCRCQKYFKSIILSIHGFLRKASNDSEMLKGRKISFVLPFNNGSPIQKLLIISNKRNANMENHYFFLFPQINKAAAKRARIPPSNPHEPVARKAIV